MTSGPLHVLEVVWPGDPPRGTEHRSLGYIVRGADEAAQFPPTPEGLADACAQAAECNARYRTEGGRKEGGGKTAPPPRRPKGSARGRRAAWTERYGDKT